MISGKLIFPALALLVFAVGLSHGFTFLVVLALIYSWQRLFTQKNYVLIVVSLVLTLLLGLRYLFFFQKETSLDFSDNVEVVISVKETSWKIDGNKLTFIGSINKNETNERLNIVYQIKNKEEKKRLNNDIPETVNVKGILSTPQEPSNFNQFDYGLYLKSKNIFRILKATELVISNDGGKEKPTGFKGDALRQRILSHIDRTMTSQSGTYTKTLLFADKRTFKSDVMEHYKELGIIHLLSISGLHVTFLINLLSYLLIRIKVSRESVSSCLLFSLPLYGVATGFGISVTRALGQVWIKRVGEKMRLSITVLDSWSLMLILTLFFQPYSLYTISFQLSYLISFVIIILTHQPFFERLTKMQAYIVLNILLLITSIPILSYHFYGFSWGVLVLNSFFIPLVAGLLLPLLIVILFMSFLVPESFVFHLGLFITDKLIQLIEVIAGKVSANIDFSVITGRLSPLIYLLLAVFIVILLVLIEKNVMQKFVFIPIIGITLCIYSVRYSLFGQVLMIDVGQGEAILIKEPWGKGNYLIDTGGQIEFPVEEWERREEKFDIGKDVVLPVLRSEGINKLESIIITHPDIDHYGGMLEVINYLPTKQVISSRATFIQENFQSLFPSIESYGTIIKEAVEGSGKYLPEKTFALISNSSRDGISKNNNSLVLYGMIGKKTWLFTGDLETEGEKSLLVKYPTISADILKVGHHGSKTSTHEVFIDQLKPETALISSGQSNRYGHPHDSVIEKLVERGISIYRTDVNGAVKYRYTNWSPAINIDSYLFSFDYERKQRGE